MNGSLLPRTSLTIVPSLVPTLASNVSISAILVLTATHTFTTIDNGIEGAGRYTFIRIVDIGADVVVQSITVGGKAAHPVTEVQVDRTSGLWACETPEGRFHNIVVTFSGVPNSMVLLLTAFNGLHSGHPVATATYTDGGTLVAGSSNHYIGFNAVANKPVLAQIVYQSGVGGSTTGGGLSWSAGGNRTAAGIATVNNPFITQNPPLLLGKGYYTIQYHLFA